VKEHLARKGVISRVQGRKLAQQLEYVSVAGGIPSCPAAAHLQCGRIA